MAVKKKKTKAKSQASKKTTSKVKKTNTKKVVAKKSRSKAKKKPAAKKKGANTTRGTVAKAATTTKEKSKKLTPRDITVQNIRQNLIEQKEKLIQDAETAMTNDLPGQILFPDMGDQASAEIDRNFMLRLKGREQKLINKIESVLETIDQGTYGICESCGNEIEVKRLEARPVTTLCIECKIEQEEEERLRE